MHIMTTQNIMTTPREKNYEVVFPDQGLFIGDKPKYGIQISGGLHNIRLQLSLPKLQPLLLN